MLCYSAARHPVHNGASTRNVAKNPDYFLCVISFLPLYVLFLTRGGRYEHSMLSSFARGTQRPDWHRVESVEVDRTDESREMRYGLSEMVKEGGKKVRWIERMGLLECLQWL
jgi:hypothetical protein